MIPWHLVELDDNPDVACVNWQQMFLGIVDNHAPCKRRRVRNATFLGITPDVRRLMLQRNKFKKKIASKFLTEANWSHYWYIKK